MSTRFIFACLVVGTPVSASGAPVRPELSMSDRAACQRKIQEVYWRQMAWPASNPDRKPSLDQVSSFQSIERQAEKSVLATILLEQDYGIRIDERMLQAELNRMARDTKAPETLRKHPATDSWSAMSAVGALRRQKGEVGEPSEGSGDASLVRAAESLELSERLPPTVLDEKSEWRLVLAIRSERCSRPWLRSSFALRRIQ